MDEIKRLIKKLLYTGIIVKEWKECGEFIGTDRVVVVGNLGQAIIIKLVLKEKNMKVYYCTVEGFKRSYKRSRKIKWILLDKSVLHMHQTSSTDTIFMPNL